MITTAQQGFIRTDFAGPGGSSTGLKMLGLQDVGVEYEANAVATARAAGHQRWLVDVRECRGYDWPPLWGYCASPECQTFSMAGKGEGRAQLKHLMKAAELVAQGRIPEAAVAAVHDDALNLSAMLSLEPLYVIATRRPTWVALEQVPGVQSLWDVYAQLLPSLGYSVATGVLNAEQYGVPQTRRRAILVAHLEREAVLPTPTHSRYYSRSPQKLDEGVLPWVSMAQALGWGEGERVGFPRRADGRAGDTERRSRDLREATLPGQVVTEKARSWIRLPPEKVQGLTANNRLKNAAYRDLDEPAPTITGGHDFGNRQWVLQGNQYPNGPDGGRQQTKSRNDGIRVTVQEAGILQSFPADYPWQGSKSRQFQQVGNAVPPLLQAAVVGALLGSPFAPRGASA